MTLSPFTPQALARIANRQSRGRKPAGWRQYVGVTPEQVTAIKVARRGRPGGTAWLASSLEHRDVARPVGRPAKDRTLRPIRLQHIESGKVISAPSIAAFCAKAKLDGNDRYHLTPIVQGTRLHHKGWAAPEVINAELALKDVFGNTYRMTVGEWTKHLGAATIRRLREGQAVGSLAPAAHDFGAILPVKAFKVMTYTFRKGDGRGRGNPTITAPTLAEAALKLGIGVQGAFDLAHGYRPSVKGCTFIGAETEKRATLSVA